MVDLTVEIQMQLDRKLQCPKCKEFLRFVCGGFGFSLFSCTNCRYTVTIRIDVDEWKKTGQGMEDLTKAISDVWEEHDGIDSWIGLYWLVQKQLEEIEEDQFTAESFLKEMADILIVIIRWFDKIGLDPKKVVLQRLKSRHEGKTKKIRKKYEKMFCEEQKRREEK